MIYLIGGAPRVGKSIIAKQLMEKTGTPWLSTDVLRGVFAEMTPSELREQLFPYAGATDNDDVFGAPIPTIVQNQLTEANSMKEGLLKFIQHQIDVHDDFILEGVHIVPEHIEDVYTKYPRFKGQIKSVFIIDTDTDNILRGLKANTSHHDWLSGAKPGTYNAVAEFVKQFSTFIESEGKKYNLPIYIKTANFSEDTKNCIELLSN